MNWKLWTWPRERRALEEEVRHLRALAANAEQALDGHRKEMESTDRALRLLYAAQRQGDVERILSALAHIDEKDSLWSAVHCLLDIMEREERGQALRPGLSAEDRSYNNGRAACMADVQAMLVQQWLRAKATTNKG